MNIDFEKSSLLKLITFRCEKEDLLIDQVNSSEISFIISIIQKKLKKNLLILTSEKNKDLLYENLKTFFKNIHDFPSWETFPFEDIKPSFDIIGKRFEILHDLINTKQSVLITTPHSLLQKVLTKESILKNQLSFKTYQTINIDETIKKLISLGYKKTSIVSDKAEFAIRGFVLDIFPVNSMNPYRIELFGDTIESIRSFDNISQKSIEKEGSFTLFLADELDFLKKESLSNLSTYLEDYVVVFDDLLTLEESFTSISKACEENEKFFITFETFIKEIKPFRKLFFSSNPIQELYENITLKDHIEFDFFKITFAPSYLSTPFVSFVDFLNLEKIDDILFHINDLTQRNVKITFLSKENEKKHLLELLEKNNIKSLDFIFEDGFLSSGFIIKDILHALIPYAQITNKIVLRRQKWRSSYHTPAAEFHNLEVGDLVVHFHSGIGKYLGVEKHLNHLNIQSEFLIIEYAQGSKLYVPVQQSHLISKYIGSREEIPSISNLGTNKWQKTKLLAQKQIIGYAAELLNIQAQRELQGGFEYPQDSEEMQLFELDFPYTETIDQKNAIEAIKTDMTSKKAMDRLILGDVGYGKTEVAMRAAFKAVIDGKKQVAVLAPTTVLAMQHYETFKQRMSSFPVIVEHVSRFNSSKKNKEIIEKTKEGRVDILIGTHRILSKDVFFKDLGLIIIDEEQRFGVKAKEHLKSLSKGVDTITLSATPIPRTLYMSIIKVKEISLINTPPQDRLPIKTIIAESFDEIIKNAILREIFRQGQVFFIHNRVESIYLRASHIQKLLPDLRIKIVHGQMSANAIDETFHEFKQGNIDVLFSTTIVENGVDIPNANTIIIDRADTFGMSDLYQLRGRVGRWNRSAYCYFLTPKNKEIKEISRKRLTALLESSGYGGGMKIAMKDLELRGAGDILGIKQSGQISNIGFHLYCKLLNRAVESLKDKKSEIFIETKMEFSDQAYIPETYVEEANIRMELYYRLGEAFAFEKVDEILIEMQDRFSTPPDEVNWLITFTKIRIFANQNNFTILKFMKHTLFAEKMKESKKVSKTLPMPKKMSPQDFLDKTITLLKLAF